MRQPLLPDISCHYKKNLFPVSEGKYGHRQYTLLRTLAHSTVTDLRCLRLPDQATDVMAVVSSANIFYVSENNIYSATEIWNDRETRTEIVRIGYRDGKFTDGAAGSSDQKDLLQKEDPYFDM